MTNFNCFDSNLEFRVKFANHSHDFEKIVYAPSLKEAEELALNSEMWPLEFSECYGFMYVIIEDSFLDNKYSNELPMQYERGDLIGEIEF